MQACHALLKRADSISRILGKYQADKLFKTEISTMKTTDFRQHRHGDYSFPTSND